MSKIDINYLKNELVKRGAIINTDISKVETNYTFNNLYLLNIDDLSSIITKNTKAEEHTNLSNFIRNVGIQYDNDKVIYDDNKGKRVSLLTRGTTVLCARKTFPNKSIYYYQMAINSFLNNIRDNNMDHFCYLYGCEIIRENKINVLCSNVEKINVYMEYIVDSISFRDYIRDCDDIDFLYQYINISNITREAFIKLGFIHFDLHSSNIVLVPLTDFKRYNYTGGKYIENKYRIVFLDYEFSYIKNSNIKFDLESNKKKFLYENDNPITDLFKLLMNVYEAQKLGYSTISLEVIKKLFSFFSDDDIEEYYQFNRLNNHYFNIPKYYPEFGIEKLNSYILHIKNIIKEYTPSTKD